MSAIQVLRGHVVQSCLPFKW